MILIPTPRPGWTRTTRPMILISSPSSVTKRVICESSASGWLVAMKHPLSLRSVICSGPATVTPSTRQLRSTGRRRCLRRSPAGCAMSTFSDDFSRTFNSEYEYAHPVACCRIESARLRRPSPSQGCRRGDLAARVSGGSGLNLSTQQRRCAPA